MQDLSNKKHNSGQLEQSSEKQGLQRREVIKKQTSGLLKTRRGPTGAAPANNPTLALTVQSSNLKTIYKPKTLKLTEETTPKLPRSGSQRQVEREESKRKLLDSEQAMKGTRDMTPRRHSYSRMLSQSRKEIQI